MLVLVDTSVWLDHFRSPFPEMVALLGFGDVVTHSVVIGELAAGNLRQRTQTLADLMRLLEAVECPVRDVLAFIDKHKLYGCGLSWGDLQLLAAANLNSMPLWTLDIRLRQAAEGIGHAWTPP